MRLIDADNLLAFIKEDARLVASCGEEHTADDIMSIIMTAPPIDAEPVRHGRWEPDKNYMREETGYWWCPLCRKISRDKGEYCSHCSTKMDLKED